jgi:hypothetical protein
MASSCHRAADDMRRRSLWQDRSPMLVGGGPVSESRNVSRSTCADLGERRTLGAIRGHHPFHRRHAAPQWGRLSFWSARLRRLHAITLAV